jgi:hypothetical protein
MPERPDALRLSLPRTIHEPEFHEPIVGPLRIEDRQEKSLTTVEESRTQYIGAEEGESAAQDSGHEPNPSTFRK